MIDYEKLSAAVLEILVAVRDNRARFGLAAREREIEVEQLAAAAIAGLVRERMEPEVAGLLDACRRIHGMLQDHPSDQARAAAQIAFEALEKATAP